MPLGAYCTGERKRRRGRFGEGGPVGTSRFHSALCRPGVSAGFNLVQEAPRLADTHTANSVPRNSKLGLTGSSRRTRVEPVGSLSPSDFQVLPKSSVTYTKGLSSSERWASKTT